MILDWNCTTQEKKKVDSYVSYHFSWKLVQQIFHRVLEEETSLQGKFSSSRVICVTWFILHSGTLGGLFSQILQGEDIVRERAIKFLSTKLKTLPEEVMTKEVEEFILTESKKVSVLFQYSHKDY